jgi:hypothetical protein
MMAKENLTQRRKGSDYARGGVWMYRVFGGKKEGTYVFMQGLRVVGNGIHRVVNDSQTLSDKDNGRDSNQREQARTAQNTRPRPD